MYTPLSSYYTIITQASNITQITARNDQVALATKLEIKLEDASHIIQNIITLSTHTIEIYKPIELGYTSMITPKERRKQMFILQDVHRCKLSY